MTLAQLFVGWFYYGILYMGLSVLATIMLGKVLKKWYLAPLIINALAITVLFIGIRAGMIPEAEQPFALYFIYMPIVFASVFFSASKEVIQRILNKGKSTLDIEG